jgi:hypothetical protein
LFNRGFSRFRGSGGAGKTATANAPHLKGVVYKMGFNKLKVFITIIEPTNVYPEFC